MKVTLNISDLEAILTAAKAAHMKNSLAMNTTVEIEVVSQSEGHGISDSVQASLQYGWNEAGSETFFTNSYA